MSKQKNPSSPRDPALKEALSAFFRISREPFIVISLDGQVITANPAACNLLRIELEELRQRGSKAFIDENDGQFLEMLAETERVGSAQMELYIHRKDNTNFLAEVKSCRFEDGRAKEYYCLTLTDLSEKKSSAFKKYQIQEKYHGFMRSASDGFIVLNDSLHCMDINKAALEHLEACREDIIGRKITNVILDYKGNGLEKRLTECLEKRTSFVLDNFELKNTSAKKTVLLKGFNIDGGVGLISSDVTELRRAQKEVAAKEAIYRGLFDNMSTCVAVYQAVDGGKDFIIVDFNKSAERVEQIPRDKLIGRKVTDCFPGVEEMTLMSVFRRVYQTGVPESHPESKYQDDRIEGWRRNFVYKLPTGEIVAVYDDVTEQVENRRTMAESETFLRQVIDSMPAYVFVKDYFGNFVLVNATTARLYGRTPEEMEGTNERDYRLTEDYDDRIEQFLAEDRQVIETQETMYLPEIEVTLMDGDSMWIQTVKVPISHRSNPLCVLVVSADITEIKRAENALRESEEKYRLVVENANEAIVVAQDDKAVFHNKRLEAIIGYDDEKIRNTDFIEFVHPDDRVMILDKYNRKIAGEELHSQYDFRAVDNKGEIKWMNINSARIIWEGNPGILSLLTDITERKKLEAQFLQAQKMDAIGRLAGGIAHDFNNILTVIEGNVNLVLLSLNQQDPLYQDLDQIERAVKKAAKLTTQLLAFSRKQTLQPKVVNLSKIVLEIKKMLLRVIGEDIELITSSDAYLWNARIDPGQLEQALLNIAINARDAMPGGGKLTIHSQNELITQNSPNKQFIKAGEYVNLKISDTGSGMSEEVRQRAFEPFFTTKKPGEGTGLGLSMVFGFVKQSGGYISLDSRLDEGTALSIYFPRTSLPEEALEKAAQDTVIPRGNESVLVVEDNDEVRYLAVRILKKFGYKFTEARSALEALNLYQSGLSFDLIITDVIMPHMKGTDLLKQVRELYNSQIKVLFISGYSIENLLKEEGFDQNTPLLVKPFDPLVLIRKVRQILDE